MRGSVKSSLENKMRDPKYPLGYVTASWEWYIACSWENLVYILSIAVRGLSQWEMTLHMCMTSSLTGWDLAQQQIAIIFSRSTHWGRVTHICVGNLTIIGSDNGLSPGRRQAITWTNVGILLIGPLGTNFGEMLIEIHTFSFKKIHLKISSGKWRPFCFGLNVLKFFPILKRPGTHSLTWLKGPIIWHPLKARFGMLEHFKLISEWSGQTLL